MGKRGPKPKPSKLKVFEGNPGKRPLNDSEPEPDPLADVPDPPEWLGEHAQAAWREVAPSLQAVGCLTSQDLRQLSLYCEAWQEFFEARRIVEQEGMVALSSKGSQYQHPALGAKHAAMKIIRQVGNDFGLSPAARVGLAIDGKGRTDDLDQFKTSAG